MFNIPVVALSDGASQVTFTLGAARKTVTILAESNPIDTDNDGFGDACDLCGNAVVNSGESCDDGNSNEFDGCSSTCQVESGYACSGSPSSCQPAGLILHHPYNLDGDDISGNRLHGKTSGVTSSSVNNLDGNYFIFFFYYKRNKFA